MPSFFVTPCTIARQLPLSRGFPRQEYWTGIFPTQRLNLSLLHWQVYSSPLSHQGSPPSLYLTLLKAERIRERIFPVQNSYWLSMAYEIKNKPCLVFKIFHSMIPSSLPIRLSHDIPLLTSHWTLSAFVYLYAVLMSLCLLVLLHVCVLTSVMSNSLWLHGL